MAEGHGMSILCDSRFFLSVSQLPHLPHNKRLSSLLLHQEQYNFSGGPPYPKEFSTSRQ